MSTPEKPSWVAIPSQNQRPLEERLDYGLKIGEASGESAAKLAANMVRQQIRGNALLLDELGLFPSELAIVNGKRKRVKMIRIEMLGICVVPSGDVITFSRSIDRPRSPSFVDSKLAGDREILNGAGDMSTAAMIEIRKKHQRKKLATMLQRLEDKTIHAGGLEDPIQKKTIRKVLRLKPLKKSA